MVPSAGRLRPLGLGEVSLRTAGFWGERQRVNRAATLDHIEHWLERAGWLGNFALEGERHGREFSDTEIYKFLEALAWEYGRTRDPSTNERFRAIAARVAGAQQPDGYLNTNFGRPGQQPRYSDLEWGHELYSYGHLIQAAVARARTVGLDDQLVQVALRAADHVCEVFGVGGIESVCGHAEIEPALVELYRVTGDSRYLEQARLFIERRGHHVLSDIEFGRSYFQDDVPVREATVFRGHAVRAMYLSAGAVDVAVETGDEELLEAVARQWRNTIARRTYLTGGIGARHQDEAFGDDFVLPPDRAYSETCASVGSVMLAWRLLLVSGDARYADLIERTLFNVIATSPSADGTRFFYTNTLHQRSLGVQPPPDEIVPRASSNLRAPWFTVSCCPTNLARTFASLAAYLATTDDHGVQIHQYAASTVDAGPIALDIDTDYPSNGRIAIHIRRTPDTPWTLTLRVPAWATGASCTVEQNPSPNPAETAAQPAQNADSGSHNATVPSADLTAVPKAEHATIPSAGPAAAGWLRLERRFAVGDTVVLNLPVTPRLTFPDPRIDAVRGCVAVERGPVVYCAESVDLPPGTSVDAVRLDPAVPLIDSPGAVTAGVRIQELADGDWPYSSSGFEPASEKAELILRPYHDWASRGPSTMRVWLQLDSPGDGVAGQQG
ncbi:glycoside hydrolase family 127 protein [Paractinoplanes lichenicola]|uniref:Glycoside hydrolase family 127 protein n=1 Tax=Paractinoplanes lichenicola TaxID=2802976 RepID=A0ABS1VYK8_9ACTN|nr:beta-L-arabinofuranosidase domain-containing protein [Actinoplanes lichenicola]MBL7259580.1 glycoside hydrolase family 127 protein [Actinoplanes lichenicola]